MPFILCRITFVRRVLITGTVAVELSTFSAGCRVSTIIAVRRSRLRSPTARVVMFVITYGGVHEHGLRCLQSRYEGVIRRWNVIVYLDCKHGMKGVSPASVMTLVVRDTY